MKKYFKVLCLLSVFLFCALSLSGCGHYKRSEAAAWFKENIADETIAVSKDYTERENEYGYTDHVWNAYLKDLPEVKFELISHAGYSLFPTYDMETTYHLEMGKYYLEHYLDENPGALNYLEISENGYSDVMYISGVYDTKDEIADFCRQLEHLDNYILDQKYPCRFLYGLAYREPLTYPDGNTSGTLLRNDTYVSEAGGTALENDSEQDGNSSFESPSESLRRSAEESFAHYAAVYRLNLDLFTEEQLKDAVNADSDYRFTITRPDGTQLCYPELLLRHSDEMSFGTLYEVLLREGNYQLTGSPEAFTFTSADGSIYSFSYSYYRTWGIGADSSQAGSSGSFYCLSDNTEVYLSGQPLIDTELFAELTGLTFAPISD